MEDDWEGAFEDDRIQKRPIDEQVQHTLTFAQEHETILQTILAATSCAIAEAPESHYRAIRISVEPNERVLPQDLLIFGTHTDVGKTRGSTAFNENLHKILIVLIFLCDEMKELKDIAETKFYQPLIMFGNMPEEIIDSVNDKALSGNNSSSSGERERMIGRILPLLQELSNFIDRSYAVSVNLIQQLSSLMSGHKEGRHVFQAGESIASPNGTAYRPFLIAFQALGEILTSLITLDCIIRQNETLRESWVLYKTMVSTFVRNDPGTFDTDQDNVVKYERLLVSIDQTVMTGQIFKGCIEQQFEAAIEDDREVYVNVRGNQVFFAELLNCFKLILETSLNAIGTTSELNERYQIIDSMALYALFRRLLPANITPDMKLHKVIWSVQKTVPLVVLCGKIVWTTGEFLNAFVPLDVKKLDPPVPLTYRRQYVQVFDQNFSARTAGIISQTQAWLVLAETKLQPSLRHEEELTTALDIRGTILLKGLHLANRISYLADSFLNIHASMQIPLNKTSLIDVCLLVENLKAIEFTFIRKDVIVNETSRHLIQILAHTIVTMMKPICSRIATSSRKVDSHRIDIIYASEMLENLLKSTENFSHSRQSAIVLLSEILCCSPYMNDKDSNKLRGLTKRILHITQLPKLIRKACDSGYLYFHLDILSPMIISIFSSSTEANRLQYLLAAFSDGIRLCDYISHVGHEVKEKYLSNYRLFFKTTITKIIISPLCQEIETDLRLHVHTKHLDHMQAINPKTENLRPIRCFLDLPPLKFLGQYFDIKREITHYLDMNFYNLTTVALHDWRMYAEMRSVALEKYDIKLMNNFLPMGSLDQGLDVLQIMRNIHIFVSRFTYNMNMQQFIEYRPDKNSKHINTIKIQSIAASIRQHGLGVLNTTVNFTYQFLITKFNIFNQFLQDDYIRAHLSREHRWFKKHRNDPEVNNCYPYDRALKFARDIRKLGVNENGKSFLDLFRITISEIGNALGYVRMVRSASMYYCSEAVKYLPELDDIISFKEHAGSSPSGSGGEGETHGAGFTEETVRAGANLDEVISTLIKNFGEGSDYFKVLVNVFQNVLLSDSHDHLKTFYIIVPALGISWIDASLQAKDNMYKAARGTTKEMYFTDDGFAMGITYCLAILKQTRKYEALHWVDTVRLKTKQEEKILKDRQEARAAKEAKIKEQKEKNARKFSFFGSKKTEEEKNYEEDYEDMEEVQTLQTTAKRLEAQRRETEQLFYSLSGASIFFKRTDNDI